MDNQIPDRPLGQPSEIPTRDCWKCGGKGMLKCSHCGGKGHFEVPVYQIEIAGEKWDKATKDCEDCFFGEIGCSTCDGSGTLPLTPEQIKELGHTCKGESCPC